MTRQGRQEQHKEAETAANTGNHDVVEMHFRNRHLGHERLPSP